MISIKTNTLSLSSQRNLSKTQSMLSKNIERISSGFRINRAADDAAGQAITTQQEAEIRSLDQAKRNAMDGVSMLQTAEGAVGDVTNMVIRMRELAIQSANGSLNDDQRALIQPEVDQLLEAINQIAGSTTFNGVQLTDGSGGALNFQVGIQASGINVINIDFDNFDVTASALAVDSVDLSTQAGAQGALSALDAALGTLSTARSQIGALENQFEVVINNISVRTENTRAAQGRIRDTDIANEFAELTKQQILSQAGAAMLAQANSAPQIALSLLN
jgi:flagellin